MVKDVRASYDPLIDIFVRRQRYYAEISLSLTMTEMVIDIMVELLSVLVLAIKQINKG